MAHGAGLLFDLIARDGASPAFLKVAGAADKAAASTARAVKGVGGSAAAMATAGAKLTKAVTLPIAAIGAVSVDQAAKWQKSMTLIQTAGGETAGKTAVLSKGLLQIAKDTGTSLGQLGEGIYTIAKAGAQKWSAVDQLKVMRAAAQGAKAENVDLATSTDALSTVMLDYHAKASDAVTVENQLIRASGLAKTTFGEFSSSLSSVVPIAAALGVKFAEVAGGIATMTQHGVSPQQATENMRNLLFNLAGQNNVASQAMQQLGIDTVDLAKNLGRRGLTGTLAIVDKALQDHTKHGMVVIDVHKAAALATHSLNTMLGDMTGPLKAQAERLVTGRESIKDYTKFAKSLGGEAGATALQFKGLYLNAEGFSNQLRSGQGTVTTSTAQYAKLLGGMTGASVAMQIAGKYAKDNARNVHEVGKAALDAGSDVLGWNKTQDTLAVKMDKAKASLQVLAVEIGTALIPAVSKIVGWVSSAVHWFQNLSGTQKELLGWSLGVMAALGPILSLGSRLALVSRGIGTFVGGISSRLATLAGATGATAASVGRYARGVSGALIGIGSGAVIGSLTRTASTAVKVGGVIASAALGAAQGWAAGGPLGAALGGLGGLLASAATAFGLFGGSAKAQIKPTDDFTQAILRDNDALGANTRELVKNKLQHDGLYDAAAKLGISQKTLTDAMMGNKAAAAQVNDVLTNLGSTYWGTYGLGDKQAAAINSQHDAYNKLKAGVGDVTQTLKVNEQAARNLAAADGKTKTSVDHLAEAHKALKDAAANSTKSLHKLGQTKALPKVGADTSPLTRKINRAQREINQIRQFKRTHVGVDTTMADELLARLQAKIDRLRGKTVTVTVGVNYDYGQSVHDAVNGIPSLTPAAANSGQNVHDAVNGIARQSTTDILGPQVSAANQVAASQAASVAASAAKQAAANAKSAAQARAAAFKSAYDTKLADARSQLAAAQQNWQGAKSTVQSAFTGTFDIANIQTQYGEPVSLRGIMRQLRDAAKNARRFRDALRRLDREGLAHSLLQQLADAGPAALPEALALLQATPKQLATINRQYRSLGRMGGQAGTEVANDMYGAGVKSAQGLVDGLLSKRGAVNKAVKTLADGMIGTLRKELNMHSPSRRLFDEGAMAFEGYRQGLVSKHAAIENAARDAGQKSIPGRQSGGGGMSDNRETHTHYHVHYPNAQESVDRGLAHAIRVERSGLGR